MRQRRQRRQRFISQRSHRDLETVGSDARDGVAGERIGVTCLATISAMTLFSRRACVQAKAETS